MLDDYLSFVGKEYPIQNKGTIIIKDYIGLSDKNQHLYEVICSKCSSDKELYPDSFILSRETLSEEDAPCLCAVKPKLTDVQKSILHSRLPATFLYGFNKNKPATLYLVKWCGHGKEVLKFGVTNRDVLLRLKEQDRKSPLSPEILQTYSSEDGTEILKLEKDLKVLRNSLVSYNDNIELKTYLPDGYSESVFYSYDNFNIFNSFFSKLIAKL